MSKPEKIVAIKGMNDILPSDAPLWELFENTTETILKSYGYQKIVTPIVEQTSLFSRAIGAVTDIVEKEMYSFEDSMNGDQLTLRPEGTASVVRAVLEHNLVYDGPRRLWYKGPMFRHERPQRGRYRQFFQFGAEAIGFSGPDIDAELIMMCRRLWDDLGIENVRLELNSIGNAEERQRHRADLIAYLEQHESILDAEAKRRLHSNPLRILDTKNPAMQAVVEAAPQLMDFLGEESRAHFDAVRAVLDAAGLAYRVNPRLVRGMDYYNLTVFEWVTDQLGSQGTVCGGGRYDGLIGQMGGKPAPAVGFGLGIERLLLLIQELRLPVPAAAPAAYAVVPVAAALPQVMAVLEQLRAAGVSVLQHAGGGSMKAQFKKADASGARYALIFGEDELSRGEVTIKSLREGGAEQVARPLAEVATWAATLQSPASRETPGRSQVSRSPSGGGSGTPDPGGSSTY